MYQSFHPRPIVNFRLIPNQHSRGIARTFRTNRATNPVHPGTAHWPHGMGFFDTVVFKAVLLEFGQFGYITEISR